MKIVTSFKHLEHTPALDEKIKEKSEKLQKYFEGNFDVHWTCYVGNKGNHCVDIKLHGPSFEYHATGKSDSMYKSFDLVIDKVEKQLEKKKSKWKAKVNKHQRSPKYQYIAQMEKEERKSRQKIQDEDIAI